MKTIIYDVMCNGRFIMQFKYRWFQAFPLDIEDVRRKVVEVRPSLENKKLEFFETTNRVVLTR